MQADLQGNTRAEKQRMLSALEMEIVPSSPGGNTHDHNHSILPPDPGDTPVHHPSPFYHLLDRLPTRYVLVFMGFLGFANLYSMRFNLSIAIVSMVNHTAVDSGDYSDSHNRTNLIDAGVVCPGRVNETRLEKAKKDGPFAYSQAEQGILLASFFYGYLISQYPGGRLAELFGGKMIFGPGILLTSILTLLTPIAADTSFVFLNIVRVLEGLCQGVSYSSMLAMLSRWSPPNERSVMVSFVFGGVAFGTLVSTPLAGFISYSLGWEWVFYVLGIFGLVWFAFWQVLCFDSPDVHPRITDEEKNYIKSLLPKQDGAKLPTPWCAMLCSMPFWALAVTHVAYCFSMFFILTELPTFMASMLHFDISTNGLLIGFLYFLNWIMAIVSPLLIHHIIDRGMVSRTTGRKIANSVGTFGPGLALIGTALSGCNVYAIIFFFALAEVTIAAVFAGQHSNMLDIAPNFAGTIMGIQNTLGSVMGFVAPHVTGAILYHRQSLDSWQTVFYIAAGINIAGNIFYLIFADAREQPWNRPHPNENEVKC